MIGSSLGSSRRTRPARTSSGHAFSKNTGQKEGRPKPPRRMRSVEDASEPFEERARDIPLRERRRDGDDPLAPELGPARDFKSRRHIGAGGDPAGNPFELRDEPRGLERGLIADRYHLVDHGAVENLRHETGADALDLVRTGLSAGQDRRKIG